MSKAVVAGHICLDLTPRLDACRGGEVLSPGKLIETGGTAVHPGGAVANTGLALKRLGVDTALCAKVGGDPFGRILTDLVSGQGGEGIRADPALHTSHTIILAVPGTDRIFLHDPGANHSFRAEDIPPGILEGAVLFHFGYPPLMRSIYRDGGRELEKIFLRTKERGILTSLDMALVKPETEAGQADWGRILRRVLPLTGFFLPSYEELFLMLRREEYLERTNGGAGPLEPKDLQAECASLAEEALRMGCGAVLIKCGARGLYYAAGDGLEEIARRLPVRLEQWRGVRGFQPAFMPDKVVSAAGAGDTCIAAFLAAAMEGASLRECAMLAAAEGAMCVSSHDTLSNLKPLNELRGRIRDGWRTGAE